LTRGVVSLPGFSGSIEDLARAIEKGEIDPLSVSVHDAVLTCLEEMRRGRKPSLDDMGSFLAAASALIHAKSKALLPPETMSGDSSPAAASSPAHEGEDEDEDDPNDGLIALLMEYRVFKRAIEELARREETWRSVFWRDSTPPGPGDAPAPTEVGLGDLISALRDVLKGMPEEEFTALPTDDLAIEEKMDAILARLHHRGKLSFRELFSGPASRPEVIAVFLALLELIRLARVVVRQDSRFGEILIHAAPGGSAGGV